MPCETVYAFACQIGLGAAWQQWRDRRNSMSQCRQIGTCQPRCLLQPATNAKFAAPILAMQTPNQPGMNPTGRASLFPQYKFKAPNARRIPKESRFYFAKSQRQSTSDGRFAAKVSNPYRIEAAHMQAQSDP